MSDEIDYINNGAAGGWAGSHAPPSITVRDVEAGIAEVAKLYVHRISVPPREIVYNKGFNPALEHQGLSKEEAEARSLRATAIYKSLSSTVTISRFDTPQYTAEDVVPRARKYVIAINSRNETYLANVTQQLPLVLVGNDMGHFELEFPAYGSIYLVLHEADWALVPSAVAAFFEVAR